MPKGWRFFVDRGGTFTDILAISPKQEVIVKKVLSQNHENYSDATIYGITQCLDEYKSQTNTIEQIRIGTTVGTNALLEKKGEPTVLVVTAGHKDLLEIGYQNRPDIFARKIIKHDQLYNLVIEAEERINSSGSIIKEFDLNKLKMDLKQAYDTGFRSVAIVLMHAISNPKHENIAGKIATELGYKQVSLSHLTSVINKIVVRGSTTVVDAYLSPKIKEYVDYQTKTFPDSKLFFMRSNGSLAYPHAFYGKDSIVSGPVGGIIGAIQSASINKISKLISFDMGGTSCDVAHYAGSKEYEYDVELAGIKINTPMLKIHTVAAGGGSILHFDGLKLAVGPDSAGAFPGPSSYRNNGPLTITDCNLLVGRLNIDIFPHVFGPNQDLSLDLETTTKQFGQLANKVNSTTKSNYSIEELAEAYINLANENMSQAIKKISTQRGYDISKHTLLCFGGAGGQHACDLAELLGIKQILLPYQAGILSAYGLAFAKQAHIEQIAINKDLREIDLSTIKDWLDSTISEARQCGFKTDVQSTKVRAFLHYKTADTQIEIDYSSLVDTMRAEFEEKHKQLYGFKKEEEIVLAGLLCQIEEKQEEIIGQQITDKIAVFNNPTKIFAQGQWQEAQLINLDSASTQANYIGPAIIYSKTTTAYIKSGWKAEISTNKDILLSTQKTKQTQNSTKKSKHVDPLILEILSNRFMAIAEQMGTTLQQTASSVNIKERLDFSCAIFDKTGNLIANAPHIPVHLGSMGECVKALLKDKIVEPNQVYATNDPYNGGTHLPDITVISPVFHAEEKSPGFFVASRGHHADIGGISPGSMPAFSKSILEEGVLFQNLPLLNNGTFNKKAVVETLLKGNIPARNPEQNCLDLEAQIAANTTGAKELLNLTNEYSHELICNYMQHLLDYGEVMMRKAISCLNSGDFHLCMDNGNEVVVDISIDKTKGQAKLDFSKSSRQSENNFNAPYAVVRAAVLYAFRTLLDSNLPLNDGCFRPISIICPQGSFLNPTYPAAVVAGNVETSQTIVDAVMGALKVMSGSQGTMNNFSFGNERYQYYETIAGGSGAGPNFNGADAIQTHMTNSRISDPEILETRYPVILEEFKIRKDSGGSGKFNGGNGVERKILFLEDMEVSILSNNRQNSPFGLDGGQPGAAGENSIVNHKQEVKRFPASFQSRIEAGQRLIIKTPGGGGYGSP